MIKGLRKQKRGEVRTIVIWAIMALFVVLLALAGPLACTKKAEEAGSAEAVSQAKLNEYEGIVKVGVGQYFYLPTAQGFDIFVQGTIESQDTSYLVGKEVRVKGELLLEEPSVFVADSIDLKEGERVWRNVFTRTEEVVLEDHFGSADRAAFPILTITAYNKSEEWEGKGQVKIYGKLEKSGGDGGEETYTIIIQDDRGREIGKILVDSVTEYARYYIKKLRLFDKFWCYLNIKETVDFRQRRNTRELFHADLVFVGLY